MKKILVSACLLGDKCRYDGKSVPNEDIQKILDIADIVPFCPEVEGGLSTPRLPAEIKKGNVYNQEGKNVTSYYEEGAKKALELCKYLGIEIAILKEKSPACGSSLIHSGYFDGRIIKGEGWTTTLLRKNSIQVFSELEIDKVLALLNHEADEIAKQKEESRLRREQKEAEKQSEEAEQIKEERAKLEAELNAKEESHFSKRRPSSFGDRKHSFGERSYRPRRNSYPRSSFKKEEAPAEGVESSQVEGEVKEESRENRRNFRRSSRPFGDRRGSRSFSSRPRRPYSGERKEGETSSQEGEKRSFHPRTKGFSKGRSFGGKSFHKSSFKGRRSFSKGGSSYPRRNSHPKKEGESK